MHLRPEPQTLLREFTALPKVPNPWLNLGKDKKGKRRKGKGRKRKENRGEVNKEASKLDQDQLHPG